MNAAVIAAADGHPAYWRKRASGLHVPDSGFAAERHAMMRESASGREITQREFREVSDPNAPRPIVQGGGSAPTYLVYNSALATTAAPTAVTTGATIKTMLQLKPAIKVRIIEWGISFDGSAAATPGKVELLETGTVAATVTASAAADIIPWSDSNAAANTAGTSGTPMNLGTTHTGYTSSGEGTVTTSRGFDLQFLPPTAPYVKQFPLNREPDLVVGNLTRVRVTFGTGVNAYCYVIFEV